MDKITDKTLIPISFIVVVVGFIFWLSALYFKTEANARSLEDNLNLQKEYMAYVRSIDQRLSRIEGHLKFLKNEVSR